MDKTIFIVDDSDTNLTKAKEALKGHYRAMPMPSAGKMFALLEKIRPDLVLLDIEMPEMDGFEALTLLKSNPAYADIPVVFLTSMDDPAAEVRGFELGVIDFIKKPFTAPVLINRIRTHLNIDELIKERTHQLQQKTVQLENMQNAIISIFADMVENRDSTTGGHIERTTEYIEILTKAMIERGVYVSDLADLDLNLMISSARLHDVGKICISDIILNKPGKFTDEEFALMKTHTTEGERVINEIAHRTENIDFLQNARLFAGCHHERWDGRGYPRGLSGTEIPIQGRIMAFADVYDALISSRPYKKPYTGEETVTIIMDGSATQFDPFIADVFYSVRDRFFEVQPLGK